MRTALIAMTSVAWLMMSAWNEAADVRGSFVLEEPPALWDVL
jgi:hypothetical protein